MGFYLLIVFSILVTFINAQDTSLIRKYNESAKRCLEEGNDSTVYYNKTSLALSKKIRQYNFEGNYMHAYLLLKEKDYKKSIPEIRALLAHSEKTQNLKELGKSNYLLALWYEEQDDTENSLRFAKKAWQVREKSGDSAQVLSSLSQLGRIYKKNNKNTDALNYYLKAARLAEQIKDSSYIYSSYINLGTLYQKTTDNIKALEFYNKALEINKIDNDTNGYAICYLKLSSAWSAQGNWDSAHYFINKCVELHRIMKNEAGLTSSLTKLAGVLAEKGEHEKAVKIFDEVIEIATRRKDQLGLMWALSGKSKTLVKQKKYKEALICAKQALEEDKVKTDYAFISLTHKLISEICANIGDYKQAYENHILYKIALDTLIARNDIKKQTELKLSYEFDQIQEKQKEEALAKEIENTVRLESEKKQRYFLLVLLLLSLVVVVIAVRSYVTKKKSNYLLEKKNLQLDHQKQLVEEKNKEINDSINYAKHIQTACLPDKEQLDRCFNDYYILFKPRDVVSGDFFWAEQIDDIVLLGVADSTGHGVPGAIMSMIGSILLNEIFVVKKIYSPNLILKELNRVVKLTLKQDTKNTAQDGMDIAFCIWNKKTDELLYSGANRPIIILSSTGELTEYKATKQAIGGSTPLIQDYELNTIKLSKGDRVIITTDGFADQFGGNKLKKINTKKLKEKFQEICSLSSLEQKLELENYFDKWKGSLEQTDDVLVFSFKA